jgi:histone acetyltransferase 1
MNVRKLQERSAWDSALKKSTGVHDASECIHINLTRPSSEPDKAERIFDEPFNPTFTHAIFEEEEKIVGYKEPRIELDFRANDLRPTIDIQFEKKIDLSSIIKDAKSTDIETIFQQYLPTCM